jgi:hypothetical protein
MPQLHKELSRLASCFLVDMQPAPPRSLCVCVVVPHRRRVGLAEEGAAEHASGATMPVLRFNFLATAALALSLATATLTAHAGPALSELSDVADYDQGACAQRAQASLVGDGWQSVAPNGYTVTADRGPLSGVIVCRYQSLTQSVPVIVIAGGDGNAASAEATALKSQMLGP